MMTMLAGRCSIGQPVIIRTISHSRRCKNRGRKKGPAVSLLNLSMALGVYMLKAIKEV